MLSIEGANVLTDFLEILPENQLFDTLKDAIMKQTGKSKETVSQDSFSNVELCVKTFTTNIIHEGII